MTKAYSEDFRRRIIHAYLHEGSTQQEIADQFQIHLSTFKRILKQYRKTGEVKPKPYGGGRPKRVDDTGEQLIRKFVLKKPDALLIDIQEYFKKEAGEKLSFSIICRVLQKLKLNRKKKSLYAEEQHRPDVKKKEKNF